MAIVNRIFALVAELRLTWANVLMCGGNQRTTKGIAMTDEPLMNEDDIRRDTVTIDRELLVRLARLVHDLVHDDYMQAVFQVADDGILQIACEQIIKEYGE
jgi:hypothetical protein